MAKITTLKAGDEYTLKLSQLSSGVKEIAEKAVGSAAGIVANAVRENLESVLSDKATGELVDSFGVSPVNQDKNGNYNALIGFYGYDEKDVPNLLKARTLESGSSRQPKRPFFRPAVNATRDRAIEVMNEIINTEVDKKILKG